LASLSRLAAHLRYANGPPSLTNLRTQHLLRGEPGIYYEDLYPLVCFLPRYSTTTLQVPTDADMLPLWKASELAQGPGSKTATAEAQLSEKPALVKMHSEPGRGTSSAGESRTVAGADDRRSSSWLGTHGRRRKDTFDPEAGASALSPTR
jgi:putative membrane protein